MTDFERVAKKVLTRAFVLLPLAAACTAMPDAPLPAFPAYRMDDDRIMLTAGISFRLAQRGRCLGAVGRDGSFLTIVWPASARLGRDASGLYVTEARSGVRFRLGDRLDGGGGFLPPGAAARIVAELREPVPPECSARVATFNPGFRKAASPAR